MTVVDVVARSVATHIAVGKAERQVGIGPHLAGALHIHHTTYVVSVSQLDRIVVGSLLLTHLDEEIDGRDGKLRHRIVHELLT